jgi:hypothetical protein
MKTAKQFIIDNYGENWLHSNWNPGDVMDAMDDFYELKSSSAESPVLPSEITVNHLYVEDILMKFAKHFNNQSYGSIEGWIVEEFINEELSEIPSAQTRTYNELLFDYNQLLEEYNSLKAQLKSQKATPQVSKISEKQNFEILFKWLLGYYYFPERKNGDGLFWWRVELRKRLDNIGFVFDSLEDKLEMEQIEISKNQSKTQ